MFRVEVDLVLHFDPPMRSCERGIRVTRTIELPFAPVERLAVFSKSWEGIEFTEGGIDHGYHLKNVTWDCDRGCFQADTFVATTGAPIAMIPIELSRLIECGWEYRSCREQTTARRRGRKRAKLPTLCISGWDDEVAATWETAPRKHRPKEFATVWRAIVSALVELGNNLPVAYAMSTTGTYFDGSGHGSTQELQPTQKRFMAAVEEFDRMTFDQQWKWRDHVQQRFPRLADVIAAIA